MGNKIYKMEYSKLMECSERDMNEANQKTQLVHALEGWTTMITSDRCAIFFNDFTNTSIMCADANKEINSKNKVKQFEYNYFLRIILIILYSTSDCCQ